MKHIFLLIPLLFLLGSCQEYICHCNNEPAILAHNDSIIQKIAHSTESEIKDFWNAYDEPMLLNQEEQSYRFLFRAAFDEYTKIYRIDSKGNQVTLSIKRLEYYSSTMRDSLINEKSRNLTREEWKNLHNSIRENCFWTMPVITYRDRDGLDGSSWILEGMKWDKNPCTDQEYHYILRRSPDATSSGFIDICMHIASLDSFEIEGYEKWEVKQ